MECIVLAGGLGTRLQGVIGAYPKSMATVNDKPFLYYLFQYLEEQKVTRVVLSLGFKHEVITEWIKTQSPSFEVDYIIEQEPLGTGGGISFAMTKTTAENVAVLNGDTLFNADLGSLLQFHLQNNAATTLALKQMQNFSRYGVVHSDKNNCITAFEEKKQYEQGLINGGIYIINRNALHSKHLPKKYSFEKDYLEAFVNERRFYGDISDAYFIDIGIPGDYAQSQTDFKTLFK